MSQRFPEERLELLLLAERQQAQIEIAFLAQRRELGSNRFRGGHAS